MNYDSMLFHNIYIIASAYIVPDEPATVSLARTGKHELCLVDYRRNRLADRISISAAMSASLQLQLLKTYDRDSIFMAIHAAAFVTVVAQVAGRLHVVVADVAVYGQVLMCKAVVCVCENKVMLAVPGKQCVIDVLGVKY